LSGDIHLLGPAAALILLNLQRAPSDTATLAASLASVFDAPSDEKISSQVDQILGDLKALALIECV
jgi:PqqD family protein of HPr-rel-A system